MSMVFNNSTDKPAVKYQPCSSKGTDDELEEISIVQDSSRPASTETYHRTSNGPNAALCGSLNKTGKPNHSVKTKVIGERLSSAGTVNLSSPYYAGKVIEQRALHRKTSSQKSLFDSISNKIDRVTSRRRTHSKEELAFLNAHLGSKEPVTPKCMKKQRRKEIQEKFGKKQRFEKVENQTSVIDNKDGCRWTFVFDPAGRLCYWWSSIVSIAFLYNFWIIIYRYAFNEIDKDSMALWFTLDYIADLLYILDIVVHFRTGFLEEGVLQTSPRKMRLHYMNSSTFYIDCLCLLPLDFMYLSIGFKSLLRCFRLVKIYRFWAFLDRTERHTNYPNAVRTASLLHYLFAIFHWNACFIYLVAEKTQDTYALLDKDVRFSDRGSLIVYLETLYWSTFALITIGELPKPEAVAGREWQFVFIIVELVVALLLFATVLGHIANIVANVSAARKEFQAKLDGVKTFMSLRRVPLHLQDRVIKWFDYLWLSNKTSEEDKTLKLLPDKLKAEIAIHVHLDTLKRVEIFQNTEAGFLCELVLKLCPVLFSPGDYICRKGEIGKEMYIVNRGRLQVVAEDGKTVLATLRPGSYFGEISILNMGNAGNRRTASVRSVGYSDLFKLSKQDLWDVLKEYPAARVRLEAIAVRRLEKYKKEPNENALLTRSQSTPGLVESSGKSPVVVASPAHTVPYVKSHNRRSNSVSGPLTHEPESLEDDVFVTTVVSSSEANGTSNDVPCHLAPITDTGCEISNNLLRSKSLEIKHLPFTVASGEPPSIMMTPSELDSTTQVVLPPTPLTGDSPPSPFHITPHYQLASPGARSLTPNYLIPVSTIGMAHHSLSYGALNNLNPNIPAEGSPADPSQEILLQELKRLRERVATLETENAGMSVKLNQQQWEVESRLAEIEMQICGSDSVGSMGSQLSSGTSDDKNLKENKESVL